MRHLEQNLERRLQDGWLNPYSIPVCVVIANQMICSTAWYSIQLWPGSFDDLKRMDKAIKSFVWGGQEDTKRPKVAYEILLREKDKGGFGLISMMAQFVAMAVVSILWASGDGDHTLQHIIKEKIRELLTVRGEWPDFSWLILPYSTRSKGASRV